MMRNKVIFIGSLPPPYHGVNMSNERVLSSRLSKIFEVYHLDISDHRGFDNLGRLDFYNIYLSLKNFVSLIFLILRFKPDLIYLNIAHNLAYLRDGIFILISRLFSKAKIIVHLRTSYFEEFYNKAFWLLRKFINITLRMADVGIVLGNSFRPLMSRFVKNVRVVPDGTDFNPDISRKNFEIRNDSLVIGYLGNLYEWKGIMDLLEAAKIVLSNYRSIKFRIAGFWPDTAIKNKVFDFIRRNNLNTNIEFINPVLGREKEEFLLNTNIFVYPSWYEGLPNVILEAMAAACPVISTKDVGAISETVIDGETGVLVVKKNTKEIADAIIYLIKHPEERTRMGLAGRKRFEENYTLEKNIDNLIRVFNEVLDKT